MDVVWSSATRASPRFGWQWAVGSRVLKCAPEQLRRATPDQQAMLNAISPELIGRKQDQRGAHVYIDITKDGQPPEGDDGPGAEGQEHKRARLEGPEGEAGPEDVTRNQETGHGSAHLSPTAEEEMTEGTDMPMSRHPSQWSREEIEAN